jgi:hypothetical protein
MLTLTDKENILKEFPNIKLSYENITHKKVYKSDYIVAIPQGKKCFAWFTTINDKMVCLIMELENKNKVFDIKLTNACFSNELSYGTIIYGTIIYHLNNRFFYIEDIFSYKGNIIDRISWGEKLVKINNMLKKDLRQISYNNNFIVFGLPLICKTNEELETKIPSINYKIEKILFFLFNKVNSCLFMYYKDYINKNDPINENKKIEHFEKTMKREQKQDTKLDPKLDQRLQQRKEFVFLIRPDIQDDIYYLYSLNNELKEEQQGILLIPNYNTSVMMNKLFRVIKENDNLDALEESDDEEEFQNENIDKFVYLDKFYKMICKYNHKFKKWVPIKLSDDKNKIVTNEELKIVYRFYDQNRKR